jgi:hypothetical protein
MFYVFMNNEENAISKTRCLQCDLLEDSIHLWSFEICRSYSYEARRGGGGNELEWIICRHMDVIFSHVLGHREKNSLYKTYNLLMHIGK